VHSFRVLRIMFLSFSIDIPRYDSIHIINGWSQVNAGVVFNCLAIMQGIHHILPLHSQTPSGEWKAEWTFGRVAGSNPVSVLICSSCQSVTFTINHRHTWQPPSRPWAFRYNHLYQSPDWYSCWSIYTASAYLLYRLLFL
jgi:hypothetical protein